MFLSKVVLQSHSPGVHRLLADIYRQHRFVLSAFPDRNGPEVPRAEETALTGTRPAVLYRVETADNGNRFFLLVQSELEPDWERAIDLHPGLALTSCAKEVLPVFAAGQTLRFRLRANPTKMYINGDIAVRANHQRSGLYREEEQRDWLDRQAARTGFRVGSGGTLIIPKGVLQGAKPSRQDEGKRHEVKCLAVDFEGALIVTDAEAFAKAFANGIGRGKAWGCGLLSLAKG